MTKALALGAALSGLFVAIAASAPMPGKPPSISGRPNFAQTLTCDKGAWSADAVSFDYAWTYAGGGPTFGTGAKLRVPKTVTGYAIVCVVTAHDAQGQTTSATSAGVTIGVGIPMVRITKATVKKSLVTLSGVVGPPAALVKGPAGGAVIVLDRRINKTTVTQLAGPLVVRGRGRFTISGHDSRGRHTYVLLFGPAPGTGYGAQTAANRTLRVP
jgi:hypothetical protein